MRIVAFGLVLALGIVVGIGALALFVKLADEVMDTKRSPSTQQASTGCSSSGVPQLTG